MNDIYIPDAEMLNGNLDGEMVYYGPNNPRPTRHTWFNPRLDVRFNNGPLDDKSPGGPLLEPTEEHPANLISSLCDDGLHRPALDIDIPMIVVESRTAGHHHVYFPTVALDEWRYRLLCDALVVCGICAPSQIGASWRDGQTLLRPPKRPEPVEDEPF